MTSRSSQTPRPAPTVATTGQGHRRLPLAVQLGHIGAAGERTAPTVDRAVVHRPGLVVTGILAAVSRRRVADPSARRRSSPTLPPTASSPRSPPAAAEPCTATASKVRDFTCVSDAVAATVAAVEADLASAPCSTSRAGRCHGPRPVRLVSEQVQRPVITQHLAAQGRRCPLHAGGHSDALVACSDGSPRWRSARPSSCRWCISSTAGEVARRTARSIRPSLRPVRPTNRRHRPAG
jgi:hypothetical protein